MAVHATAASGGMFNVRTALRQRAQGEARNAIATAFGCLGNVKNVLVVDDDIDIFSSDQMDWALATRLKPDRDLTSCSRASARTRSIHPLNGGGHRLEGRI